MTKLFSTNTILFSFFLFSFISMSAQQTVNYNGKIFGDCETIEASLGSSGETLSLFIAEHELRAGYGGKYERTYGTAEADNLINVPKGYTLILDVDFKQRFKFPIEEKDSIYLQLSKMQLDLKEKEFMQSTMATIKNGESARAAEAKKMKQKSKSIEEQAKEIAEQMKAGKISPEEAGKKLEALQKNITAMIDNSSIESMAIERPEEPTNYFINFVDTKELTESNIFSGTLRIIRFNKNEFVAELYTGKEIVECLEKRAASSQEAEKKCKETASSLFSDMYILSEGNAKISINVKLKKFQDFR